MLAQAVEFVGMCIYRCFLYFKQQRSFWCVRVWVIYTEVKQWRLRKYYVNVYICTTGKTLMTFKYSYRLLMTTWTVVWVNRDVYQQLS